MTCRQGIIVYIAIIKTLTQQFIRDLSFPPPFKLWRDVCALTLGNVKCRHSHITCVTLHYGFHRSTTSLASHSTASPAPPQPPRCRPQRSATPPPGHTHHPAALKQMHPLCFQRRIWVYEATNVPCSTRVSIVRSNIQVYLDLARVNAAGNTNSSKAGK